MYGDILAFNNYIYFLQAPEVHVYTLKNITAVW